MKLLAFAASLRKASLNRKLIHVAAERLRARGVEVDLASFADFDMPLYDADLQAQGFPPGAEELTRRILGSNGLVIASPEYNYSIAGPLKNAIDWVSRKKPFPTTGKPTLLLSASISHAGGYRGLWQTRIPFEGCNAPVFPEMYGLPHADHAFDAEGALVDPKQLERLEGMLERFVSFAARF